MMPKKEPSKLSPKEARDISHEQGRVPTYEPQPDEMEHIGYVMKRKDEIWKYYNSLGLYSEWETAEKNYENNQKPHQDGVLPAVNCGVELEVVETKTAEEKEVLPEVVFQPRYENDRSKAEAMQELYEHIRQKNDDDLKTFEVLDGKNTYGSYFQETVWKRQTRKIKEVVETDKKNSQKGKIPQITWKEHEVVCFNDVYIENVAPYDLLFSENAKSAEEADEAFRLWYGSYDQAKNMYGNFANFKYVKKNELQSSVTNFLNHRRINFLNEFKKAEVFVLRYWNVSRDEYTIIANGVLLTQYGNPIPSKYWKSHPFSRAICRRMFGDRSLHPKGDVILVSRLKQLKSLLVNAATMSVVTNANSVLITTKEVKTELQKIGKQWQSAGIITAGSKDNAQATRPIQVDSDPNGVLALISRIDEMITTLVGVDSRSLLTSIQETATKTAVRRETMLKRINAGLKLLEHEFLKRKARIVLALIKQNYEESDEFYKEDELSSDNPSRIKVPKTIPIKDKKFKWVEKIQPFSKDEVVQLLNAGVDEEFVNLIFESKDGGASWNLIPIDDYEIKCLKSFQKLPKNAQDILLKAVESKKYFDLEKSDAKGEVTHLEIRKELLETPYDIHIVPKGYESYSKAFHRESIEKFAQTFIGTPFVNGEEIARDYANSIGLNTDSIVKNAQQVQAEQMQQAQLQSVAKTPAGATPESAASAQNAQGGGLPPELAAAMQAASNPQETQNA